MSHIPAVEPSESVGRSGAMKVLRAAALAAALVPLGSVTAEANYLSCPGGFSTSGGTLSSFSGGATMPFNACETQTGMFSDDPEILSQTYSFLGGHQNTLTFLDDVLQSFPANMSAFYVDSSALEPRLNAGRQCAPYELLSGPFFAHSGNCVVYRVENIGNFNNTSGPPQQGVHYTGDWEQEILWFSFGDPPDDGRVLHAPRQNGLFGFFFTEDITEPGSYDREPTPGDPVIRGVTNNFSDTAVQALSVPEPASLLLLGAGLGAVLYRRRRDGSE